MSFQVDAFMNSLSKHEQMFQHIFSFFRLTLHNTTQNGILLFSINHPFFALILDKENDQAAKVI